MRRNTTKLHACNTINAMADDLSHKNRSVLTHIS